MCRKEVDSNERVFLQYEISKNLWQLYRNCIKEIGIEDNELNDNENILGDLEGFYRINAVLNVKKTISVSLNKKITNPIWYKKVLNLCMIMKIEM